MAESPRPAEPLAPWDVLAEAANRFELHGINIPGFPARPGSLTPAEALHQPDVQPGIVIVLHQLVITLAKQHAEPQWLVAALREQAARMQSDQSWRMD